MRAQSGSIDSIAGTEPERSDLCQTTETAPAAVKAASERPDDRPAEHGAAAANGTAIGTDDNDADEPINGHDLKAGVYEKKSVHHFRRYSTGEDFEASAGPRGKDGYGDASDTRHVGTGSRWYDPRKDVVLRIECATDAQTRVCGTFFTLTSSRYVPIYLLAHQRFSSQERSLLMGQALQCTCWQQDPSPV